VKGSNTKQSRVSYCKSITYIVPSRDDIGRLQTYITPLQIYMGPMSA